MIIIKVDKLIEILFDSLTLHLTLSPKHEIK